MINSAEKARLLIDMNYDSSKHQIQVNQYMSGEYIQSFFGSDISELSIMASKLKNGLNKNEITLVSKNTENKGFFEKFFQLFS